MKIFQATEDQKVYFNPDGTRNLFVTAIPGEKLMKNRIGNEYNSSNDDSESRSKRISAFENVADSRVLPFSFDNNSTVFSSLLDDGEKLVIILHCEEAEGLPFLDKDRGVKGDVFVALAQSDQGGYRLLFSIMEGSVSMIVNESFYEKYEVTSTNKNGANVNLEPCCCGFKCCCFMSCCTREVTKTIQSNNTSKSGAIAKVSLQYTSERLQTAQFSSLPLHPCVIEAMTYRSADIFVGATGPSNKIASGSTGGNRTTVVGQKVIKNEHVEGTEGAKPTKAGAAAAFLKTTVVKNEESKEVKYNASVTKRFGDVVIPELEPLIVDTDIMTDDLNAVGNLTFKGTTIDNIFVIFYYRSVLQKEFRACKLKILSKRDSCEADFKNAQRFVSIVTSKRIIDFDRQYPINALKIEPMRVSKLVPQAQNMSH